VADTKVRIEAFGQLAIHRADRHLGPRDLGGVMPRHILEILISARGHAVRKDRLIELLWGDLVPKNPSGGLESYISILRTHLHDVRGKDIVETGPGAYRFANERADLDLDRFDSLLAKAERGRTGQSRSILEDALALVRGEVFEDEPTAAWAVQIRERYRTIVRAARLDGAEAALVARELTTALRHSEVVREEDPGDERACRLSMLAMQGLGRQEDAIGAYLRCREYLHDELGMEPLPETESIYLAIVRRADPRSLLPADAPRVQPGFRLLVEERLASTRWTTDTEMRIVDVSGDAFGIFGVVPAEILGRRVGDLLTDSPPEPVRAHRLALGGEAVTHELQLGDRIVLAHVEPLRDHTGMITGATGVALDITERRRAEATLEAVMPRHHPTGSASDPVGGDRAILDADNDLRSLDASAAAIFVVDPYTDEILDVSQGAATLLGYERDEMRGMQISALYHSEATEFLAFLRAVGEGGAPWTDGFSCMDADGRTIRTELAVAPTSFQDRKAVIALLRPLPKHRTNVLSAAR
jgi:PAS domain S-box-containing protein